MWAHHRGDGAWLVAAHPPDARPGARSKPAPWLAAELEIVRPRLVVLLGATAAKAQLGPSFRVTQQRGRPLDSDLAELVVATVHPSSILRGPPDARAAAEQGLVDDLEAAFSLLSA